MNQQLVDKLLHKAGARFGAEGTDYSDFTSSKFAELIVKECNSKLDNIGVIDRDSRTIAMKVISEHFGVEE